MTNRERAYPGIYMAIDPRPRRARALVESMLAWAGSVDSGASAIEGDDFALIGVCPPGENTSPDNMFHSDSRGMLICAGDMSEKPAVLHDQLHQYGAGALADIDGSFCGAWFDAADHSWTIFNDRWGLIPLFWWSDGQTLIVSPKARISWRASGSPLRLNQQGAADLLRTQNMLGDHTLIEGVHWLEPAHCLRWDGEHVRLEKYWNFQHRPQDDLPYESVLDSFVEAARATISRMTAGNQELLQGISGGLDSRLFLAVCHEHGRLPSCYTSGFAYSEDMRFGRKLARAAGSSHDALLLNSRELPAQLQRSIVETDGLHGAAHLAMSAPIAAHLAHHQGALLLEGYLHGVLGGSDLPADEDVPADRPAHTHGWAIDFLHSGGKPDTINALLRADLAASSQDRWRASVDTSFARSEVNDPLYRAEYAIITGRSGRNDVLVPAMFRRHVRARHPACDARMIDWYARTPARYRRARQAYIDVLRRYYPAFARVPRADACSGMPLKGGRWAREYHWRLERLYSVWAKCRYPEVRRWGRDSLAGRAWAFDACAKAGLFEPVLQKDARILQCVKPESVRDLWQLANRDSRHSIPLLTLVTIETMIRHLEKPVSPQGTPTPIQFSRLNTNTTPAALVEAS